MRLCLSLNLIESIWTLIPPSLRFLDSYLASSSSSWFLYFVPVVLVRRFVLQRKPPFVFCSLQLDFRLLFLYLKDPCPLLSFFLFLLPLKETVIYLPLTDWLAFETRNITFSSPSSSCPTSYSLLVFCLTSLLCSRSETMPLSPLFLFFLFIASLPRLSGIMSRNFRRKYRHFRHHCLPEKRTSDLGSDTW